MKIIRNTEDLARYVEINATSTFDFFSPSVNTAERRFLKTLLGDAQFNLLADAIAGTLDDDLKALAELAQEGVANIAASMAVTRLALSLDENGARRTETEKVKSAYQYQEINTRESYVRAGYDALDEMLSYLETNADKFPAWTNSTAYKDYKKYFIQSGIQFSDKFNIRNSRYTYLTIRSIMQRIEDFDVKPVLGKQLFNKLKADLLAGSTTDIYRALLENYIRPAIALLTIAKAVVERAVDVSDFGVSINIIQDNNNSQQKQAAPLDKIREVALQLKSDGDLYLSQLADELTTNSTNYPEYEAPAQEAAFINIKNKQTNSFLAV
jgi:hypothetical protein